MAHERGRIRISGLCVLAALALGACAADPAVQARGVARLGGDPLEPGGSGPYEQAKALLVQGRPALAVSYLRRALIEEGRTPKILNALAVAYAETRRDDLSLQYFQEALTADPGNVAVLNNIGFAALRQGDLGMAQLYLARADAAAERQPTVRANLVLLDRASMQASSPVPAARSAPEPASLTRVVRVSQFVQRLETFPQEAEVPAGGAGVETPI